MMSVQCQNTRTMSVFRLFPLNTRVMSVSRHVIRPNTPMASVIRAFLSNTLTVSVFRRVCHLNTQMVGVVYRNTRIVSVIHCVLH